MPHFSSCNILSDTQFGFQKNYSAKLQLIKVSHDLGYSLNNKGQTDVVLLDFSKAFNKVSHHVLLTKLQHYGIQGFVLNWISDFIIITHSMCHMWRLLFQTDWHNKWCSKRSVLEQLLFLACINDISDNLSSSCHLFADDCILYRDIKSAEDAQIL